MDFVTILPTHFVPYIYKQGFTTKGFIHMHTYSASRQRASYTYIDTYRASQQSASHTYTASTGGRHIHTYMHTYKASQQRSLNTYIHTQLDIIEIHIHRNIHGFKAEGFTYTHTYIQGFTEEGSTYIHTYRACYRQRWNKIKSIIV